MLAQVWGLMISFFACRFYGFLHAAEFWHGCTDIHFLLLDSRSQLQLTSLMLAYKYNSPISAACTEHVCAHVCIQKQSQCGLTFNQLIAGCWLKPGVPHNNMTNPCHLGDTWQRSNLSITPASALPNAFKKNLLHVPTPQYTGYCLDHLLVHSLP